MLAWIAVRTLTPSLQSKFLAVYQLLDNVRAAIGGILRIRPYFFNTVRSFSIVLSETGTFSEIFSEIALAEKAGLADSISEL